MNGYERATLRLYIFSAVRHISRSCFNRKIASDTGTARSASANLLKNRRYNTREQQKDGRRSFQPNDVVVTEDYLEIADNDRISGRLIHSAGRTSLRNKPEQFLNISPMECFVKGTRIKPEHQPLSTSLYQNSNSRVCRSEVKMMYSAFQFQFTESYCKPACPKEPEVATSEYRGVSPMPSEYGLSDRGKRHRRSSDKISLSSSEKLDKKARKTSAKSLSRKNSTVSTLSLKSQQTLVRALKV